jgi:beta-lactamase superfamily II metal-dependent hydrolase
MSKKISRIFVLVFFLAVGAFAKGTAHFLALKGEGSASVVIDDATETAYITDGGKGKASGIQGAAIDGERVLDYLLGQQVKRLVITCSHPHSDHMGGLRAAVRSSKIKSFDELVFIDNDYERRERARLNEAGEETAQKRESLVTIYENKWGKGGKPPVTYRSAFGKNAFEGLARKGAEVLVSNFAYDPKRIGKNIHDEAVVTQYDLSDGVNSIRMVDFDDASTALVDTWVGGPPPPKVNVLVVPHHGSANNNISEILSRSEDLGLRDVIIPVNLDNQYNHPDPEVLRGLLERFRPEHVFLTGSVKGDNVEVTTESVQAEGGSARNSERLASFLRKRLDRLQTEAQSVIQTLAGRASERAEDLPDGPLSEATLEKLAVRQLITPEELTLLRRVVRSAPALEASLKIVAPESERRDVLAGLGRGLDPLRLDRFPSGFEPEPPESGGKRYKDVLASQKGPEEPPLSGSGKPRPEPPRTGGPGSGVVPSMFEEEMARESLTWGGVMLGNKGHYEGSRPVSLEFPAPPSDVKTTLPVIRVHFEDGDSADYADVTPTELWAAYNFIQPSAELKKEYGPIPARAAGLVGAKRRKGGRDFAIHPAIIGTYLARESMRLDIVIRAAGTTGVSVPAALIGQKWSSFDSYGYQWFDEEARIRVHDGRIEIEPESEPKDCFLRFRVEPTDPNFDRNAFLEAICQSFDSYRTVERFAKVIAVLNWYTEASGESLPELPTFVRPVRDKVPAQSSLPFVAVFANRPDNQIVAEANETETPTPSDRVNSLRPSTLEEEGGINWIVVSAVFGLIVLATWVWVRRS